MLAFVKSHKKCSETITTAKENSILRTIDTVSGCPALSSPTESVRSHEEESTVDSIISLFSVQMSHADFSNYADNLGAAEDVTEEVLYCIRVSF